jgi:hypothetical protein
MLMDKMYTESKYPVKIISFKRKKPEQIGLLNINSPGNQEISQTSVPDATSINTHLILTSNKT